MAPIGDTISVFWDPTSDPLNTSPSWVDITPHFQRVGISRGRSGVFDLYKVGTATLVARNGRKAVDAPWMDPNVWYRWRQIKVVYTGGPFDVELFTGHIQTTEHDLGEAPFYNTVTIKCVDKLGLIRQENIDYRGTAASDPDGIWANNGLDAGTVEAFVGLSQNLTGFTISTTGVSTAPILFPATEIDDPNQPANVRRRTRIRQVQGNFWQLLQDALEVEQGALACSAGGEITINGRYTALQALTSASAFVITDTPGAGDYQAQRGGIEVAPPGTDYYDAAAFSGTTKVQKKTSVTPSGYPETALTRSELPCPNDNWMQANADLAATLYSQTDTFPTSASLVLNREGVDPYTLLNDGVYDLGRRSATVRHTPAGGSQQEWLAIIDGVDIDIQAEPPVFKATLRFTSGDRWFNAYGDFDDYGEIGSTFTVGTSRLAP